MECVVSTFPMPTQSAVRPCKWTALASLVVVVSAFTLCRGDGHTTMAELLAQQPDVASAHAIQFVNPTSLLPRLDADFPPRESWAAFLHPTAVALSILQPLRDQPVEIAPGSTGNVSLGLELLVEEKPVWAPNHGGAITVELGYEDTAFNLTLDTEYDPSPVVNTFCGMLAIDAGHCTYIHHYVRSRVHMDIARRRLGAADFATTTASRSDQHMLRDALVRGCDVCVTLARVDPDSPLPASAATVRRGIGGSGVAAALAAGAARSCRPLKGFGRPQVRLAGPGWYQLHVQLQPRQDAGPSGRVGAMLSELVTTTASHVTFQAVERCQEAVTLVSPREGATVRLVDASARLHTRVCATSPDALAQLQQGIARLCVRRRVLPNAADAGATCLTGNQLQWDDSRCAVVPVPMAAWQGDSARVRVSVDLLSASHPASLNPIMLRSLPACSATVSFEVTSTPVHDAAPRTADATEAPQVLPRVSDLGVGAAMPLVVVSAVSQGYFEEQRLHNMVGSVHFWAPGVKVVVYSLGLTHEVSRCRRWRYFKRSPLLTRLLVGVWLCAWLCAWVWALGHSQAKAELATWRDVVVKELPLAQLPPHVSEFRGTYSFKAWIINHEVETAGAYVTERLTQPHGTQPDVSVLCHGGAGVPGCCGSTQTWRFGGRWTKSGRC